MRHIILILMIALLPARGWTSDAMTVSMALQQLAAIQNVVTRGLDMGAGALQYFAVKTVMSAECPMQMQQAQARPVAAIRRRRHQKNSSARNLKSSKQL